MNPSDRLMSLCALLLSGIYAMLALGHPAPESIFGAFFFLAFAAFIRWSAE